VGAGGIHRPIKVTPLAFHPDVRLVHAPTVVGRLEPRAQSALKFRGVPLDPSPHRDVIGMQAPLGEQLLHVTVGKREAQELRGEGTSAQLITGRLQSCNRSLINRMRRQNLVNNKAQDRQENCRS
jgi:hypothetical protein